MRRFIACLCVVLVTTATCAAVGLQRQEKVEIANSSLVAASATALSRADVALARSFVVRNSFKGSYGESIAEKSFIDKYLTAEGHWQSITPRSGPQGLDHVFVKTRNGVIKDIMIGESKFNTSQLSTTVDGNIQMSEGWINLRLKQLGLRYTRVSQVQTFGFGKAPLNPLRKLCVVLKNGKKVYFWAEGKPPRWSFTGTQGELVEAKQRAAQYGNYFAKASSGIVKFRSRVFNIVPRGNDVEIRIYDAKSIVKGNLHAADPQAVIKIKNALAAKGAISVDDLAAQLKKKLGLSDEDSIAYARRVLKGYDAKSLMGDFSLTKSVLANSAKATAVGVAIDVAIQLIASGEVDPESLAINAGGIFLGTTVGQATHIALSQPAAYNFIKNVSGPLRCSTPMATTLLSSVAGGLATSGILSYGAYFAGYSDLKTANRQMLIGSASTGAGAAVTCGAMWVATTWGTAGTGTAISSLSGAAASNAALAWLGGGTVASGGGGMAAGAAVLTGGAAVAIAGIAVAGYYSFKMYDQHEDTVRIARELEMYQDGVTLNDVLRNDHRYVAFSTLCYNTYQH